mgnify:CR=1 FL=1|tara:strand:- start:662 stop:1201 length:540 start_codon:yes stop_codon:yes gene_type:complete
MKLKRKLKKTRIAGGREIVPWVERLNYFNDYFRPEGFTLESSELQLLNDEYVCIRGFVKNKTGIVVADGIAFKKLIEPFSVQKCQSGALNRALFVFGIVDTGEETIMDENEAEELNRTTLSDIDQAYNNMKDYIKTDVQIVEKRLPKYKNQFSSLQISTLKKAINEEKAKQSENFITKK